jgi:transposase InsO family protein
MEARHDSSIHERLQLIALHRDEGLSCPKAAQRLGFSTGWARRWWRRYQKAGEAGLLTPKPPAPGPMSSFDVTVKEAMLSYRHTHLRIGARRALVILQPDPALSSARLPSARTIHRAYREAGLVSPHLHPEHPPATPLPTLIEPHAVWQIDHQDHLRVQGCQELVVLQSIRAVAAGLTIGADVFVSSGGANAVPEDTLFDALRRRMVQWGRPQAMGVDGGVRFLGQSQRTFPSRFELLCAGWGIQVHQTRPGHPTDNGAVERLHQTMDGIILGPPYADVASLQVELNEHLRMLNEDFPSRAKACHGHAPLELYPEARHSGRQYDPNREWDEFDLGAVDGQLEQWKWYRKVSGNDGQLSFANKNVRVGAKYKGQTVALRFDGCDRQVVAYELGGSPGELGQQIRRFHCSAFDKETILSSSEVAWRPSRSSEPPRHYDTTPSGTGGTPP